MLATSFVMLVIFQCIKSVTINLSRSSTSQTCHQHICSPTSVTNIDVSDFSITVGSLGVNTVRFRKINECVFFNSVNMELIQSLQCSNSSWKCGDFCVGFLFELLSVQEQMFNILFTVCLHNTLLSTLFFLQNENDVFSWRHRVSLNF